jgi:hypothetical protein
MYIYIYIVRQSINGDDYLSGAAQREQTKKNYKKSADYINSDKIKLYQIISSTVIFHTQLSYGILCHMQHSWHPLWTNLNHWPKAITTKQQTSVCK